MRIEDIKSSNIQKERIFLELKKVENKKDDFSQNLKNIERDKIVESIKNLVQKVNDLSKELSQKMDIGTLREYKKTIKELLSFTVYSSHEFFKEFFLDKRGRHKVFGMIRKIDQKMDQLTQEILKSEKDSLKILSYIDDIRGLIIDLFL
ncbi:YaaR family protein [Caldicellulosiruptoraceae bacterium PP1]